MKAIHISSFDIALYNRMDASFFIAIELIKVRAKDIEGDYTVDEIIKKLSILTVGELQPLKAISRNNSPAFNRAAIDSTIKEYPYFSLALMEPYFPQYASDRRLKIVRLKENIDKMTH